MSDMMIPPFMKDAIAEAFGDVIKEAIKPLEDRLLVMETLLAESVKLVEETIGTLRNSKIGKMLT